MRAILKSLMDFDFNCYLIYKISWTRTSLIKVKTNVENGEYESQGTRGTSRARLPYAAKYERRYERSTSDLQQLSLSQRERRVSKNSRAGVQVAANFEKRERRQENDILVVYRGKVRDKYEQQAARELEMQRSANSRRISARQSQQYNVKRSRVRCANTSRYSKIANEYNVYRESRRD